MRAGRLVVLAFRATERQALAVGPHVDAEAEPAAELAARLVRAASLGVVDATQDLDDPHRIGHLTARGVDIAVCTAAPAALVVADEARRAGVDDGHRQRLGQPWPALEQHLLEPALRVATEPEIDPRARAREVGDPVLDGAGIAFGRRWRIDERTRVHARGARGARRMRGGSQLVDGARPHARKVRGQRGGLPESRWLSRHCTSLPLVVAQ
jgi:hypothetical protein